MAAKRERKRARRLARVVCYIYPVAQHGEDWNENRIVGVSTRCIRVGVREKRRKRQRGRKRESGGFRREGRGKGNLLDRDGDDRRVGLSCRRSHRMGWLPSPLPPPATSSRHVADSLVRVESLCMHAHHRSGRGVYACDGRTNSSPNLGLIENVSSGARMRALHPNTLGRSLMRECRSR